MIHGQNNLYGDGMAMWLTKQRGMPGTVFGSTDRFEGLGIFFDTYKNNRPGIQFPYVMAMMGDGQTTYDQGNDGKANELAGCSVGANFSDALLPLFVRKDTWLTVPSNQARALRNSAQTAKARLTYFQDAYLKLELQHKDAPNWVECFRLDSVTIPSVAYLGFSAHTGELSDHHEIIRVDTRNVYSPNVAKPTSGADGGSAADTRQTPYDTRPPKSGGLGWFFFKLILFFVVVAGAYAGYTFWKSQSRGSRF